MTVLDLCLCAMMIALHIVLEVFGTIRIGNELKITFSTLPFVLIGMLCGPLEGLVTGLVGTFLSQLITFGITLTTPFWIIPGMLEGLAAGLIYKAFKRKTRFWYIAITVTLSCLVLVIFNLIASYFDGVVIWKYWTIEVLIGLIPMRLLVWVIISIIYTAVTVPLCKTLQKRLPAGCRQTKQNKEKEIQTAEPE